MEAVTQGLTLVLLGLPTFVVVAVELSSLFELETWLLALGLVMVESLAVMPTGLIV